MKKYISTVIAIMMMCTVFTASITAFADGITVQEVKINDNEDNVASQIKDNITDEDEMLQISPATLLTIKLMLEAEAAADKQMLYVANKATVDDEEIGTNAVQFIDEQTTDADGNVTIRFRPRTTDAVGIYNMRAASGNTVFSKFYKTIGDKKQPVLTSPTKTSQGNSITLTISDYTSDWEHANTLYEITSTKTPVENYMITPNGNIATLTIPTTEATALGEHTFRFEPNELGGAYNPITFKAEIIESEKEYTISFNESGFDAKTFTVSTIPIGGITLPKPEKTGYTFGGWYKENTYTTQVVSPVTAENIETLFGTETSVMLYAKWTPIEYSITYHNDDGVTHTNVTKYTIEDTVTLSDIEKTGYDFGGWYSDSELNTVATGITQGSTGNKDFYAKWTAKAYTITYNKDGGTIANENEYTSYTYGEGIMLPEPTKDGFHFIGWYDNVQLSGNPVSSVKVIDIGNKEFWAKWDENAPTEYQITFVDYNGAELQKTMVSVGETPSCPAPSRDADAKYTYTFSGWAPKIEAVSKNASYRATYTSTPRTYTVTYEKDGGEIENEANYASYTYGTSLTLPIPTKAGFDFDGWYSDSEFIQKVAEISNGTTGDKTVYAKWNSSVKYQLISVDKTSSSVKLIKRTDDEAWLVVAAYDNDRLVKATLKPISEIVTNSDGSDVSVTDAFSGNYTTVKVFMWNNIEDMIPRCPAITE